MRRLLLLLAGGLLAGSPVSAQTVLSSTVLQSDIGPPTANAIFADGSSMSAGQVVFVFDEAPEAMLVLAVSGDRVTLQRGYGGPTAPHRIGARVYYGAASSFTTSDQAPGGTCTGASVLPSINTSNGRVFECVGTNWTQVVGPGAPTTGTGATEKAVSPSVTSATLTTPVLSGSITGTYTLAGTPSLTAPTIAGGALSGTFTGAPTFSGKPTFSGEVMVARVLARESFDQPHVVLEEDFTAKVLTDGGTNIVLGSPVGIVEFREELAKTASSWVEADGVLDITADNTTDNEGVEIYLGDDDDATTGWILARTTGACFNVNFTIALIAGTDQFLIGWRQNEAFRDDNVYTGYADWSVVGINNVDGSVFSLHEVAGGGTLSDDSGINTTNASTHTLQSCIGTDGIPTASLNGTAITLTNGATAHTAAIQMNPFITYLQAGGAVDANIRINYFEITALP